MRYYSIKFSCLNLSWKNINKGSVSLQLSGHYILDEKSWNKLILLLKKDFTQIQSQFMFDMLDWEKKGYLDVLDFLNITDALKLQYNFKNVATSIENTRFGVFSRFP